MGHGHVLSRVEGTGENTVDFFRPQLTQRFVRCFARSLASGVLARGSAFDFCLCSSAKSPDLFANTYTLCCLQILPQRQRSAHVLFP